MRKQRGGMVKLYFSIKIEKIFLKNKKYVSSSRKEVMKRAQVEFCNR